MTLEAALGIAVPLFLAFVGAIFSFGKLYQSVTDLAQKVNQIGDLKKKIDDMNKRLTILETLIGRRKSDG
ncbi:MAG: hypothetical protein J7M34_13550 [Anaerolineae bacterium]|jgi:hypothetical protein|nr:hypothetical protein [Anaerolineae bacterium]